MAEWVPVPGFGGFYEASTDGDIRVLPRVIIKPHPTTGKPRENHYAGRVLVKSLSGDGYLRVSLGVGGETFSKPVHHLIALAFHGDRPDGLVICHNNGDKTDNRPENLRYDTQLSNNRDRLKHGTYLLGEKHPMSKLKQSDIDSIRERGLHYLEIIKEYGISKSQAFRIYKRKAWV